MPRSPDWQRQSAADGPAISALSQAFDLAQAPRLAAHMRRHPLPRDVMALVELASADPDRLAAAAAATARSRDFIVAAAELYLRQVVCYPDADPHRMLGVAPGASRAQMRANMRALVLWLHPDRNQRGWDAILMQRVLEAWRAVGDGAPPGAARVASPSRGTRTRRGATYRPTWIAQPLPRTRRSGVRRRSATAVGVFVLVMALVVPERGFVGAVSLVDDGPRAADRALVRAAVAPATPRQAPARR